jgi:hypothetical protein
MSIIPYVARDVTKKHLILQYLGVFFSIGVAPGRPFAHASHGLACRLHVISSWPLVFGHSPPLVKRFLGFFGVFRKSGRFLEGLNFDGRGILPSDEARRGQISVIFNRGATMYDGKIPGKKVQYLVGGAISCPLLLYSICQV